MSDLDLARVLGDLERTLAVVQATIDHLPGSAITAERLGQISRLEATRARLQHTLSEHRPWPAGSSPMTTLPVSAPLVLFLPASPLGPADVADEADAIARALATTQQLGFLSLADGTPDQILRMFAGEHQRVLHLTGPTRDDTVLLHGDDGRATAVSSGPLTALVRELGPELRLVVLHGKGSRALAGALAELGPCVIAIESSLSAPTVRLFLGALYRAAAARASVGAAFEAGCCALAMVAIPPARLPLLVSRPAIDPARVVFVDE